MQITYADRRFVARSSFAEKDIVKSAGFRWDPALKRWWTKDPTVAGKLARFATPEARAAIEGTTAQRAAAVEASRATDADIEIPVPDGLALMPFQRAGVAYAMGRTSTLIGDQMGLGKAQPVSEPVLTPYGWRPIGSLHVGDQVIGSDGQPAEVLGVYPQGTQEIYEVHFSDGASTRCTLEHLWTVRDRRGSTFTLTTAQMLKGEVVSHLERTGEGLHVIREYRHSCAIRTTDGQRRWHIPIVAPVEFADSDSLTIDPYLLGLYLGNGSWGNGWCPLSMHAADTGLYREGSWRDDRHELAVVCTLGRVFGRQVEGLGLAGLRSWEKFVPEAYIRASVNDRLALLQGLMDTDGSPIRAGGGAEFSTTSEALADAVVELTRSLGGIARKHGPRVTHYPYAGEVRDGRPSWRVNVKLPHPFKPFRSARKLDGWVEPTKYPPARLIDRIEHLGTAEEAVCIRVAAADSLYVTSGYVLTHNTIQAIGVINTDESIRSVLIIAPLSVKLNWQAELERWLVHPMSIGMATSKTWPEAAQVVIIHPDVLVKQRTNLTARTWDLLVVDEAHLFKSPTAARSKALFGDREHVGIRAKRRLAMTGTPIPNRPVEIHPILKWLAPDEFGHWRKFVERYCDGHQTRWGWDVTGASHLDELQERLRSTLMVRRLKSDVLTELPAKTRQVIRLDAADLGAEVRSVLKAERAASAKLDKEMAAAAVAVELAKASGSDNEYQEAVANLRAAQTVKFKEMAKLRHETAVVKAPAVAAHVVEMLEGGVEKVCVWAHHHDVIDILRSELAGYGVVGIVGGDSPESRQAAVDAFQGDATTRVFVASIQAAGTGITLTAASTAVFAELDWVPGNVSQCEDRQHRIGQTDSVLVQHVVLDGSLDANLAQTLVSKQAVIDAALDTRHAPAEVEVKVEAERVEQAQQAEGAAVPVVATEPVELSRPPSTADVRREHIARIAAAVTPELASLVHTGLRQLAATDDDHARELNGVGFSKFDVGLGHDLASRESLSPKQAALGACLLRKYRRQLPAETNQEVANLLASGNAPKAPAPEAPASKAAATPRPPQPSHEVEVPVFTPAVPPGLGMAAGM